MKLVTNNLLYDGWIKFRSHLDLTHRQKKLLDLTGKVSYYGPSPKALKAVKWVKKSDISTYPGYGHKINKSYSTFIKKLAATHHVAPEYINVTNGVTDGLRAVLETFIKNSHEELLVFDPSFLLRRLQQNFTDKPFKRIDLLDDTSSMTTKILSKMNEKTKVIAIENPTKPTGKRLTRSELTQILRTGKIVLVDETHSSFSGGSMASLVNEFPNLIILRSFSKDYGLSGLRIGYTIAQPDKIKEISKKLLPFNVNSVSYIAASKALDDKKFLNKVVSTTINNREYFTNRLEKEGFKVYKSYTNFLLIHFAEACDTIYTNLLSQGIKVLNFPDTPLLKEHLLMTVPNKRTINKIMNILIHSNS